MIATLTHLKKQFGDVTATDIDSFTTAEGDLLGIVGNNGAGKTTLFRLMLDLQKPDEGHVVYTPQAAGQPLDVAASEDWKPFLGAYIDDSFLIDFLTPDEYFAFLARISGIGREELKERLAPFGEFTEGEVFGTDKLIRNLSAGNKQKVGIISALFRRPEFVILDEPFNFLDPTSQSMLKHLIADFNSRYGSTILISSHNLYHTTDLCRRIVILEHGRIIRDIPNNGDGSAEAELKTYFDKA